MLGYMGVHRADSLPEKQGRIGEIHWKHRCTDPRLPQPPGVDRRCFETHDDVPDAMRKAFGSGVEATCWDWTTFWTSVPRAWQNRR